MRHYTNSLPDIGEIVMCTVTQYNDDSGYTATLDEYDIDGLMAIHELSNKKIKKNISSFLKIGDQYPLEVIDLDSTGRAYLSKKNIKADESQLCKVNYGLNVRLFGLARRLESMTDVSADTWTTLFREMSAPGIESECHPMTLICDRTITDSQLPLRYIDLIDAHHAKLFGVRPVTSDLKFTIQNFGIDGALSVSSSLVRIRDRFRTGDRPWTNEELYLDHQRANVDILPIAIPSFTARVKAYQQSRCDCIVADIRSSLSSEGYDYLEICK